MLFVGAALLIAIVLALFIASDAGSLVGLSQAETGQLLPLVLILIIVAGGAFSRRRRLGDILTGIVLWVGIFGIAIVGYAYREEVQSAASRVFGEISPGQAMVDSNGSTARFRRGMGGSFRVNVDVNGYTVPMVFDTGATAVVLTHDDARNAGIDVSNLRYNVRVQTANGIGMAALSSVDQMRIGGINRIGIRSYVAEKGALSTSLLGMSFLETLSSYTVTGDSLEFSD